MTQKTSDESTLGLGNLSLPNLAQPNLTTTATVTIQSNAVGLAPATAVYLGDGGGLCVVPWLGTDFTSGGTGGSRAWLVSGTAGSADAEYVFVKDRAPVLNNGAGASNYELFAKKDGSGIAYSRSSASGDPDPHGQTMYLSLSSGRLLEIPYVANAFASSDYAPITSDHSKAGSTNEVIGAYNTGVTTTLQTSSKACLVNVIS